VPHWEKGKDFMTSRERMLASLNHRQPDKVPLDFGATPVTGIHVRIVSALRDHYGLEKRTVKAYEPYQMLGLIEADLQEKIGVDIEGIPAYDTMFGFPNENWKPWMFHDGFTVLVSGHFLTAVDIDGSFVVYPEGDRNAPPSGRMPVGGYFFDSIIRQDPLEENSLDPEDNLEEFGPLKEQAIAYFERETARAKKTGRALLVNFGGTALGDIALVPAPFMKHPKGIRDIQEWYISTLTRQDYVHQIFEKQIRIALENLETMNAKIGDRINIIFLCGADFGTQTSTFCSEEVFRNLYMPYYRSMNDWIHTNTAWKTFKHSCGAVEPLIPAFIECGFDILNPVQVSASGMDPEYLKKEYGKDIVFWGGGVDTQHTLRFGTPDDVQKQVFKHCEIFNRDGGFVFNAVHNIQGDVPVENVTAMFDALKEFNGD
jgi:hypothetical protein